MPRRPRSPSQTDRPPLPASPTVLLLVDFFNPLDFPGAETLAEPARRAALASSRLRRRLDREGCATIFANDNYGVWHSDFAQVRRHCAARGEVQAQIGRVLAPRARDFTVLKPRHSAFFATPLALLLDELRCRRLVVAGLAADNCVLFTAMDAYLRGHKLWIPSDCVAAETPDACEQALRHMARVLKADITPAGA